MAHKYRPNQLEGSECGFYLWVSPNAQLSEICRNTMHVRKTITPQHSTWHPFQSRVNIPTGASFVLLSIQERLVPP